MLQIGPYSLDTQVALAPMAGVTDRPFRQLCRELGAGLVVSEMVTSDPNLWHTRKSSFRLNHQGEAEPRSVQIAGGDPEMMALAAQLNAERGAQIIDINMGCPAKKVCNKAAGSALLKDEPLVESILEAVVNAVDIPVTLKIRTGWSPDNRNALTIAKMAEQAGIAALTVHGRTRSDKYLGDAEYETIKSVKENISIPVIANGDITTPEKARFVLDYTGADAVMIGRAAQGTPWILREIDHYLRHGEKIAPPTLSEIHSIFNRHLKALHEFYGELMGVRIARKHLNWYLQSVSDVTGFRKEFNQLETAEEQLNALDQYFDRAQAA
ncbi:MULTISPECIES: tRNA dihydrouridine synthase DusB [unclassified Marinobacterium]|jgi:tRNA-dihydrouridine synthase B|uniref:tRNA dihydrouridine synthase DusB n=1 Tax=unclassified Marinobacterium TaxID=2644139 RepID=UPI001567E341|nr:MULTISPECIES: tRNA dihydrouridine synthase DusB [unclassified Marinobacterium]NRP09435.1 tRNA-dihydrouridine synthase C [Marinobacterium sp. xm-g-48]NRP16026.1 tRNA-dihydrouridine synthase C [Marinobacterium sp. xm-a-152]NRP26774.1 tRNA-dihydrouridine synthase C [Marinobacterium sp. xm-d-420]NRP35480.1 tRNA-dihydrouridine synthase C [Marinobacterium sp. xm-d-579]NRP37782.1 tRNA-dihydrouridine synthase C [Marinobacterium sp. xm-a-121]